MQGVMSCGTWSRGQYGCDGVDLPFVSCNTLLERKQAKP
jgi:hypothetical protein